MKKHSSQRLLGYYIAYYMFPGFVGKLTGNARDAEQIFYVWSEIGLIMVYLHLVYLIKAKTYMMQFVTAIMLPFFSIPLWISEYVLKLFSRFNRIGEGQWFFYDNGIKLQYSSNFTLLHWVVP